MRGRRFSWKSLARRRPCCRAFTRSRHFACIEELESFCRTEVEDEDYEEIDLHRAVERARSWKKPFSFFENLMSTHSWQVSPAADGSVSVPDPETGRWISLTGEGLLIGSEHQAQFHHSTEQLDTALKQTDYVALGQALATGASSVEAYIRYRSYLWNLATPSNLLKDDQTNKVRFSEKIDHWIPTMTGGARLDKSGKTWQDFIAIKEKHDNAAVHAKRMAYAVTYPEFASLANRFSTGIAGLLFELHKIFEEMTPSSIIKASYAPKVVWVPESE